MAYQFIQAKNYTKANRKAIDVLVIHTMESPQKPDTAENVAQWFAGSNAPQASAHYCIDVDSIVQCVRDENVAWHAPGANSNGLGFEHAGKASETAIDWGSDYNKKMLALSAKLAADKCKQYGIPAVWLSIGDLVAGKRGITSHNNVSKAFKRSDHHDPGLNFPVDAYIAQIKKNLGAAPQPNVQESLIPKVLKLGANGPEVRRLQSLLNTVGDDTKGVDGQFGDNTLKALKKFQQTHGIPVNGVADAGTWKALTAAAVPVVYHGPA